jgi:Domain of unknown function (DUF1816)
MGNSFKSEHLNKNHTKRMSIMTLITEPSISLAEPLGTRIDPTLILKKSFPLQAFIAHLTLNNKLSTKILNLWSVTLNAGRQAWWIEILTAQPNCTYYFGPFAGAGEAEVASKGFVDDLESEFAQDIKIKIDRHSQPDRLTIEHD